MSENFVFYFSNQIFRNNYHCPISGIFKVNFFLKKCNKNKNNEFMEFNQEGHA